MKVIKAGEKLAIKKVNDQCYQLVKVLSEHKTLQEAKKELIKRLKDDKL